MPPTVDILFTSAAVGNLTTSGQTVTYNLASLQPGASTAVYITTRIRDDIGIPFTITNVANMTYNEDPGVVHSAQAVVRSVTVLPVTGQMPLRLQILRVVLGLSFAIMLVALLRRMLQAFKIRLF